MKTKLEKMTKAELYKHAQQHAIQGRSKMSKTELLEALAAMTEKGQPNSRSNAVQREKEQKRVKKSAPAEVRSDASSAMISPPPHPTAPQYLTPAPVEVYQGEEGPALPEQLPTTVLEAMPRDPHWMYLYWDICQEDKDRIRSQYGEWIFERSVPILRIHDVETETWRDMPVLLDARNWYLPVIPDRPYQFELGVVISEHGFVVLASSREIRTPAAEPSFQSEEQWLAVEELYRDLIDVYGEFTPGVTPGSPGSQRRKRREAARRGLASITSSRSGRP
ncbi:MAG: DUF4912 domain-containing protein, partial [bacterium]